MSLQETYFIDIVVIRVRLIKNYWIWVAEGIAFQPFAYDGELHTYVQRTWKISLAELHKKSWNRNRIGVK